MSRYTIKIEKYEFECNSDEEAVQRGIDICSKMNDEDDGCKAMLVAALANRFAGQRFADDMAAGHLSRSFQGLSAGNSIIAVMLSNPDGKRAFFSTPAAIVMALVPPRNGLTFILVTQELCPAREPQPHDLGSPSSAAARIITRTV